MGQKVKSRKSFVTKIEQETNEILGEEFLNYSETYNEQEQLIEEKEFDAEGNILGRATYTYSDKGVLQSRETYLEGNILNEKETFQYLENGEIEKVELLYGGGGISRKFYAYSDGRVEISTQDDDGENEGSEVRILNANGDITERVVNDEEGKLESKKVARYDEHNNLVEIKIYGQDEELVEWQTFEYDSDQKEVKRILYSPNGETHGGVTIEYNDDGKILRQKAINRLSGAGNYERIFSYENNEEWMEMYDGNDALIRQHYRKYDAEGRLLMEETSKAPRSGIYSPIDNSQNYFVIRNEYAFWE